MADFRKLLLVLTVMVFAASAVYAQPVTPFGCSARQGGQVPTIRDGGLSELVGDVLLDCSGGPVGGVVQANFQIFMNTTVSNRIDSDSSIPTATDAMLIINDTSLVQDIGTPLTTQTSPVRGFLQANLVTGDVKNTRNSILFSNVVLPTGTTTTIRIANVRVVAPAASNSFIPTQVLEFVSTSPVGAVAITNPQQPVAVVLPGLLFDLRTCNNDGGFSTATFQQCISEPRNSNAVQFLARFREAFPTAFKNLGSNTQGGPNSVPGSLPNTEHGLTFGGLGGAALITSRATNGTQLILRFTNVPAGVSIYASTAETIGSNQIASMVSPTSGSTRGTNICYRDDPSTSSTETSFQMTNLALTNLTLRQLSVSGGTASATWEVGSQNPVAQDILTFAVQIRFTANVTGGIPGLTAGTAAAVNGAFAPISTVDFADTSSSIPRFLDRPIGATAFNINPCVTNLLFPFVSNAPGFDTGIALVNTSLDNATGASGTPPNQPLNTSTQAGACTVYYFNAESADTPPTTPPQVAPQTTRSIAAGGMVAFALSQGGVSGATSSAVGFQGYIIARCNFQYAHGYAFISDPGAQKFAHGYLALVIPDRGDNSRPPDPFTTAGSGSGEMLAP